MASGEIEQRKCFSFIWKIEDANYLYHKDYSSIRSPSFTVDELEGTVWTLLLFSHCHHVESKSNRTVLQLLSNVNSKGGLKAGIKLQVAFLASDGSILLEFCKKKGDIHKDEIIVFDNVSEKRADVFDARKSEFLPQGALTICCRIWKSVGEFSKDTQWVARSRIVVEKRSFSWEVGNFNNLDSQKNYTYEIKSIETGDHLISLELFLTGTLNSEEIRFAVVPKNPIIKLCPFELYSLDAFGNTIECLKEEFQFLESRERKSFLEYLSKAKLMKKNEVLSLRCVCSFASGAVLQEVERIITDSAAFEISVSENRDLDEEKASPNLKKILNDDFKSMLNEGIQSDIKLRTINKTLPAHKCILSARSPVFKAMFSNDMKENTSDCVDIEDLNDDTVSRLLRYIYSGEIEELEWESATQLYEAADKYEILPLRDACSSCLKQNLCPKNACKALVLADLHQDDNLKGFVQRFILKHSKDIMNSEEWMQFMKTNLILAAETMHLKFKD